MSYKIQKDKKPGYGRLLLLKDTENLKLDLR